VFESCDAASITGNADSETSDMERGSDKLTRL
jgi:hypothetical protein